MTVDLKLFRSDEISLGVVTVPRPLVSMSSPACSRNYWHMNFTSSALRAVMSASSSPVLHLIRSRKCIWMACIVLHFVSLSHTQYVGLSTFKRDLYRLEMIRSKSFGGRFARSVNVSH